MFEATKTNPSRTIDRSAETVTRLAAHRKHQAEIKLRNRLQYTDLGLMFAKEWGDLHNRADSLGLPLQVNTIGDREFARLIKAAGVRRIKFHGLRLPLRMVQSQTTSSFVARASVAFGPRLPR